MIFHYHYLSTFWSEVVITSYLSELRWGAVSYSSENLLKFISNKTLIVFTLIWKQSKN